MNDRMKTIVGSVVVTLALCFTGIASGAKTPVQIGQAWGKAFNVQSQKSDFGILVEQVSCASGTYTPKKGKPEKVIACNVIYDAPAQGGIRCGTVVLNPATVKGIVNNGLNECIPAVSTTPTTTTTTKSSALAA